MPNRLTFASTCSTLILLGISVLPSPALAGFEWVAPSPSVAAPAPLAPAPSLQPVPSVQTYPVAPATTSPEVISPVIIEGKTSSASPTVITPPTVTTAPTPVTPRENVMRMQPLLPPPSSTVTTTVTTTSAHVSEPTVRGFAKQVPLAVALRQILPSGYGFSVDPDVDLGVLISFQGGKPWRETLADALQPAGLVMRERSQMISIGRAGSSMSAAVDHSTSPVTTPTTSTTVAQHILEPPAETISQVSMPATVAPAAPVSETWQANRGDSLHKVLDSWAHRSNVEMEWLAEYDYPLQATFSYSGYFEDAVRSLLTGFEEAHPQPIAELHSNTSLGQRVLVVQTRGNSYSD